MGIITSINLQKRERPTDEVKRISANDKPSKVWAFFIWHFLILVPLSFIMTLFVWGAVSGWLISMIAVFFFGSLFSLFLMLVLFTRIKVNKESVAIQSPFAFGGGVYYGFDELHRVKLRMSGRAELFRDYN